MDATCKPSRHYITGEKTLLWTPLSCSGPGMSDTDTICRPSHQTTGEKTLHYSSVVEVWTTWLQHADQANIRPLAKRPCYQLSYSSVAEACTTWSQHADKAIRPSVKPSCYRCYSVDEEWAIWTQHADQANRPSAETSVIVITQSTKNEHYPSVMLQQV